MTSKFPFNSLSLDFFFLHISADSEYITLAKLLTAITFSFCKCKGRTHSHIFLVEILNDLALDGLSLETTVSLLYL